VQKLILASQSAQRKIILETTGLTFEVVPADIDEQGITAKTELERAKVIALAKAKKVLATNPNSVVMAADTYTVVNDRAYEKPATKAEAKQMLLEQSGKKGVCLTGFAYLDPANSIEFGQTAVTDIEFRELLEEEIDNYVKNNPVTTWSAGFCPAYPAGLALISQINGSNTGFSHGLPMEMLIPLLQKSKLL
jgi:septum formation protein